MKDSLKNFNAQQFIFKKRFYATHFYFKSAINHIYIIDMKLNVNAQWKKIVLLRSKQKLIAPNLFGT